MKTIEIPRDFLESVEKSDLVFSTARENDGFFETFKENSGTHVFAGHDHNNNFVADYKDVKLCYLEIKGTD